MCLLDGMYLILPSQKGTFLSLRAMGSSSLRIPWDLQAKVFAFIDYYNWTMAKPFKWTYQGKALTI